MVEVPVVREVPPGWRLVVVAAGVAIFIGFVSPGLVLQDLRDEALVRFGCDEYLG